MVHSNFKPANELNAQSLFDVILETLYKEGVDIQQCVSQCYNGASVMSGHLSGIRRLMTEMVPGCFYIHCNAHKMNLCIVDCVKGIGKVADFFEVLQRLVYIFISGSVVHKVFSERLKDANKDHKAGDEFKLSLKRHSDTRWTSQFELCRAARSSMEFIVDTL